MKLYTLSDYRIETKLNSGPGVGSCATTGALSAWCASFGVCSNFRSILTTSSCAYTPMSIIYKIEKVGVLAPL